MRRSGESQGQRRFRSRREEVDICGDGDRHRRPCPRFRQRRSSLARTWTFPGEAPYQVLRFVTAAACKALSSPCALVRALLVRARLVRIKDASYRCTRRSDIAQRGSFLVQVFFRGRVLPRSTGRSCLLMPEPATCGLGTHESCPKDRTPFDWQKPWSLGEETPDDTTARTQPARTQPAQIRIGITM